MSKDKKGKGSLSKFEKTLLAAEDREQALVQQELSSFYPGVLANFSFASERNPFAGLSTSEQKPFSQEQMQEECDRIRQYVRAKKPNNIEVRFNEGAHYFNGKKHPLGTTIAKFRTMDSSEPTYLYVKDGDTVDAMVFIGGENILAFLATKDKDGKEQIIRLSEFHLLSCQENTDPNKEVGLLTSFVWPGVKIYSSVLLGSNLFPVKNLLLSEWLQDEWQRAKDAAGQPANQLGRRCRA